MKYAVFNVLKKLLRRILSTDSCSLFLKDLFFSTLLLCVYISLFVLCLCASTWRSNNGCQFFRSWNYGLFWATQSGYRRSIWGLHSYPQRYHSCPLVFLMSIQCPVRTVPILLRRVTWWGTVTLNNIFSQNKSVNVTI